jgi:hypothetical protein
VRYSAWPDDLSCPQDDRSSAPDESSGAQDSGRKTEMKKESRKWKLGK